MIVTSETTALVSISMAASTGRLVRRNASSCDAGVASPRRTPPTPRKRSTGTPTVPKRPSGSRTKILISSHASCERLLISIPNRVAGEAQEHVLERRHDGVEVGHGDGVTRHTLDDVGHQSGPVVATRRRRPV